MGEYCWRISWVDFLPWKINPRINLLVWEHVCRLQARMGRVPWKFDLWIISAIHNCSYIRKILTPWKYLLYGNYIMVHCAITTIPSPPSRLLVHKCPQISKNFYARKISISPGNPQPRCLTSNTKGIWHLSTIEWACLAVYGHQITTSNWIRKDERKCLQTTSILPRTAKTTLLWQKTLIGQTIQKVRGQGLARKWE